jgi:Carboxypeptidase regulatory-like domain
MNRLRSLDSSLRISICLCLPAVSLFAQAGSLAGSVTDQSSKPVTSAIITAHRETLPVASGKATSAADGTFQIGGLLEGSYTVCVQVTNSDFLDTCEWSTLPLRVDVQAGQPVVGLKFQLQKGAIVQVRLNDPGNLLAPAASTATIKTAVPHVLMGVETIRGLLRPVALVSKDATGTTHAVTVPFDTALSFTVVGTNVSLADEKGAPVGQAGVQGGPSVPLKIASGTSLMPLTFNVTGPKLP